MQRALTDFGADYAFGQVPDKLHEHYGIDLASSTIRKITQFHAQEMYGQEQEMIEDPLKEKGCAFQVGQIDGSMIPIMTPNGDEKDQRKNKTLHWKEARLAIVQEQDSLVAKFGATFEGDVNDAGNRLFNCAVKAGFGNETHLHSVSDGAPWIALQIADKFGEQGSYLVDFYHVCEYLADAGKTCAPNATTDWTNEQKNLLKNNEFPIVISNLEPYMEAENIENDKAPVRACHRYLNNRTDQLDYKSAIEAGLPIGSGAVESAHRYIIQKRLKLSGAWWKASNVDPMLSLRVVRANGGWDSYWDSLSKSKNNDCINPENKSGFHSKAA